MFAELAIGAVIGAGAVLVLVKKNNKTPVTVLPQVQLTLAVPVQNVVLGALPENMTAEEAGSKINPITPAEAWKNYVGHGGMAEAIANPTFQGGLGLWELNYLKSLDSKARHQWAVDLAAQDPFNSASYNTVNEIDMTRECASYLMTITANYGISFDA